MVTVSIAKAGLRRAVRQPLFYILVGLFGILIFLAQFLILFTFGEETTMLREVGTSAILMCGLILAVFLAAESISAEEESRTLAMLLAHPVKRYQIVLGKFLGTVGATFAALSALTALFIIILVGRGEEIGSAVIVSLVSAFAQSAVASSVAILLSTILPFAANVVTCSVLFVIGSVLPALLSESAGGRLLCAILFSVLPNFSNFNFTGEIARRVPIPSIAVLWALLYAVMYIVASLSVAVLILRVREVK
jgi:ABC-type transport system involved in multi-copper enzyme maturation permease subunit